jgi:hypothetical protein
MNMKLASDCGSVIRRLARGLPRAFVFFAMAAAAMAQEYPWQVESSITADTGKYGTNQKTDLFYWPVTLKRYFSEGDVALTVPYIDLNTEGGQTVVDGTVVQGHGSGGSGLGDVLLKGRYNWIEQTDQLPFVDLVARLKLPTADENKGLGTGEADFGVGAELARRFLKDNMWFGDLSYTFIGDPPDIDYDNRVAVELGLGHDFLPDLMGCVFYDYRSAISDGSEDAHSVSFLANYRVSKQVRTYAMIDLGLSDGAPDYGATVGASYRFR